MDTMNPAGASNSAGMSDAEMAAGLAGLPAPPALEAPSASAGVRWLTDVKRVESYELVFPFAIGCGDDEVEYRTIIAKRLSAGEVAAFVSKLRAMPDGAANPRVPMFYVPGPAGDVEIPDEAWEAMDDDDRLALLEISERFLPARFRR